MKQEMMGWQWRQLDYMQIICTLPESDNHANTSSLNSLQARCSSWRPSNSVKALKTRPEKSNLNVWRLELVLMHPLLSNTKIWHGRGSSAECKCETCSECLWVLLTVLYYCSFVLISLLCYFGKSTSFASGSHTVPVCRRCEVWQFLQLAAQQATLAQRRCDWAVYRPSTRLQHILVAALCHSSIIIWVTL